MDDLFCLFCHHKNKLNVADCANCGASLVLDETIHDKDITGSTGTESFVVDDGRYQQCLRKLPIGALALFVLGRPDPIIVPNVKKLIMGRDTKHTGEQLLNLTRYGQLAYSVSRRHALIQSTSSGFALNDLGSTNGTWLNHQPLKPDETHLLKSKDQVRLGLFSLTVCFHARSTTVQPLQLILKEKNTLLSGNHFLSPPYLLTQIAPYLQALNDLQQVMLTCMQKSGDDLTIHQLSSQETGVAVKLDIEMGTIRILQDHILPWQMDHAEILTQDESAGENLREEIHNLAVEIVMLMISEEAVSHSEIQKLVAALNILINSPLEPIIVR
ncbi:MAG: FHA domain-containing protein [Chloroflexi bacterium]|nr:FHA domain-containing protein [Chloroflexota bacterium]